MGNAYSEITKPKYEKYETSPNYDKSPTFDPKFGFPNGRTERVMIATHQQMDEAGLDPEYRDYCAHLYIDFQNCHHRKFPLTYFCKPEKNAWSDCAFDDFVIRMKEYERERRLLERTKRNGTLQEHLHGNQSHNATN